MQDIVPKLTFSSVQIVDYTGFRLFLIFKIPTSKVQVIAIIYFSEGRTRTDYIGLGWSGQTTPTIDSKYTCLGHMSRYT